MSEIKTFFKEPKPWRSKEYRDFIDSKPCIVPGCRRKATHHHQPRKGECNRPKVGDDRCLPICLRHHVDGGLPNLPGNYHGMGEITGWAFYSLYDIDVEAEIKKLNEEFKRPTCQNSIT